MAFNYDKHKSGHDAGHEWVAFSDLYLCLSTVFLFLFVVASLRAGTTGVQTDVEVQRLTRENMDLQKQLQVYEVSKDDYLKNNAAPDEAEQYKQLMDKLSLLKEEAKDEKNKLLKQARENEIKAGALNQYQQMIRNVINQNMIAAKGIKRRDVVIDEKKQEIEVKDQSIQELESTVAEKRQELEQSERKIAAQNSELDKRVKQLRSAYKQNKLSKKVFEAQTAKLRNESQERIEALRNQSQQIESQLAEVAGALTEKEKELQGTQANLQAKTQEAGQLANELKGAEAKTAAKVASLKEGFAAEQERLRGEFEAEMGRQKLAGAARAAKEAEFRAAADARERQMGDKLAGMNAKMAATEGELAKAKELANARKKLSEQIKGNFAKAGIKATVDEGTGDVYLDFGDQYFETGRAELKGTMRSQLEKAIPVYSSSLFNDPKIASKIQNVEIIGFASPTYKGKFIDPKSLNPGDRKAVDYNLDLSYARAKAIFNHVFDTNKMNFKYQKELLPLVKVTGRSFLAETKGERSVASGTNEKDFCKVHDCKKAQRVIIKFNLGE